MFEVAEDLEDTQAAKRIDKPMESTRTLMRRTKEQDAMLLATFLRYEARPGRHSLSRRPIFDHAFLPAFKEL
jgi:hypothetical protein